MDVFENELLELVDPAREPEMIADGFDFTEGPVWNFSEHHLTFVDLAGNVMYRWDAGGGLQKYRDPSGFANGLTYDRQGSLLSCEHRARRITRETTSGLETVVDSYKGKKLNAPNDLVVANDGSIIFTDPHYGLTEGYGGPGEQELAFRGVYRLAPEAAEPDLLVDDFDGPNGLALSPDEKTLLVADSEHNHIRRFAVGEDWELSGGEILVELPSDEEGVTDGFKLDRQGNIFSTGPGGIWICSPEGAVLGFLKMSGIAANLAWGGDGARTLFITASTEVYSWVCQTTGHVPYLKR